MKSISVILSSSKNFRNTGMFSVDYAAYKFFSENFPSHQLKFYVFGLAEEKYYPYEDIMPYGIYNDATVQSLVDIYTSDLIVYWGDFHHTRHFFEGYFLKYVKPTQEQLDLYWDLFFLRSAPQWTISKAITFGNSLVFLDETNEDHYDDYHLNFNRLYKNAHCSTPRDNTSLKNLCDTVGTCEVSLGCDAALLIPATGQIKENKLGLFIGRRCEIKLDELLEVIKFARKNKLKIEWIPWMINLESLLWRAIRNPRQAKNLFLHYALSKIFAGKKPAYENDFNTLGRFKMVVTDTYHVAVNSLKEETPVFCISHDKVIYNKNEIELHDKKKGILYSSMSLFQSFGVPSNWSLTKTLNLKLHQNHFLQTKLYDIKEQLIEECTTILGD